jgi:hypothetical protein
MVPITVAKRRYFRFSLRTLFVVTTIFAVCCAAWPELNVLLVHARREFLRAHGLGNGFVPIVQKPQKTLPIGWSELGAYPIHYIHLDGLTYMQKMEARILFPDAYIIDGLGPD